MITITNEDCMELMARTPDKYFDLSIVDPPYGINMDNQYVRTKPSRPNTKIKGAGKPMYKESKWDNERPTKQYFDELFRVSKEQIIWGSNYFNSMLPDGFGFIYWDKMMGDNYFSSGEIAFCSMQVKASSCQFPSMRVAGTRIHPTQKPTALYRFLLDRYAKPIQDKLDRPMRIFDSHLGSGSIAIACHDYGFDLTACELDTDYFAAAMKRLHQHQSQLKLTL